MNKEKKGKRGRPKGAKKKAINIVFDMNEISKIEKIAIEKEWSMAKAAKYYLSKR